MTRSGVAVVSLPAVAGLLGLAVGLGEVGILSCWFLVALCVPGGTVFRRFAYAVVPLFALNAALLTILALADRRCSPALALATYLVLLPVVAAKLAPAERVPLMDRHDGMALGLAGITAALLLPPLLHASPGEAMALISQTTDGGNHTQLVLATQRSAGYLTFRPFTGLRPGMENYPGAWSGNVWMLGRLLLGRDLQPIEAVRLLGVLGVLSYSLLTMLLTRLALALAAALSPASRRQDVLTVVLVAMTTSFGFGLFLVNLASYTQILAVIGIVTAILVVSERSTPVAVAVVATASTVVVAQTWYLLLPVVGSVLLVAWANFGASRRVVVAVIVVAGPLALFPVMTGPGAQHVQSSGSLLLPVLMGILGLLAATGAAVAGLLRHRPTTDGLRLAMASAVVASLLLALALVLAQPHDAPGASYYTAKVFLIMFLLGSTAAAAIGGGLERGRSAGVVVLIGLLCSVWSTRDDALPPRAAHTSGHLEAAELDAVFTRHQRGLASGTDVWIADGCDRVGDLVATKWIYDLNLAWNEARTAALDAYTDDPHKSVEAIATRAGDPTVRSLEVVVRRDCQPTRIAELAKLPKVTVIRVS